MNKLIGMVMAAAKLKDGTEVEIRHDKFHYRAYNAEEQQVGPERVDLDALMTEIGGELTTGARSSLDIAAGGRDKAAAEQKPEEVEQKPEEAEQKPEEAGGDQGGGTAG